MSTQRTFVKRIMLDSTFSRSTQQGSSNHWVETTVKAYRVIATNNEGFKLDIVADPFSGSVQGIPMNFVRLHNYTTLAKTAVLENKIPQAGVWVDILFSVEDNLIWSDERTVLTAVSINEGSLHSSSVANIDVSGDSVIFNAKSSRLLGTFQNKGPGSVWVGNPTAAELKNPDYQNICEEIPVGGVFSFKNKAQLCGRSESGVVKLSVRDEE